MDLPSKNHDATQTAVVTGMVVLPGTDIWQSVNPDGGTGRGFTKDSA